MISSVSGLLVVSWVTLFFWKLFGAPTAHQLICLAIADIAITQLWIITLAYRILVFVMDLGADINLMPEAAARIAISYYEGRPVGKK